MKLYLFILIVTMIIQTVSRYIYVKYKKVDCRCNYTGNDVSGFILSRYRRYDIKVDVLTYTTNYEQYDIQEHLIQLKESVYYGTSITALAIAAQRTYLYLVEEKNLLGKIKVLLTPFAHVTSGLSWFCIVIGIITGYDSFIYLGISILIIVLVYNLITMILEIQASRLALRFLSKEIVEEDELPLIKLVLTHNIFFYVTNYAQTIFDLIYYTFKNLFKRRNK